MSKTHLKHQQGDYYQNWFVFHQLSLRVELYMNPLIENQFVKVQRVFTDKVVKQREKSKIYSLKSKITLSIILLKIESRLIDQWFFNEIVFFFMKRKYIC